MGRTARVIVGPGRPYDLILICLLVAAAVLLATYDVQGPLGWVLGFVAIFFAPGYALVSLLLPGQKTILSQSYMVRREERLMDITMLERIALAFGLSAALMALGGTIMTRGIIDLDSLVVGLETAAFTYIFSALAIYRRSRLPSGDQFVLAMRPRNGRRAFTQAERAVSAVLIAALAVLAAVTVTGLTVPPAAYPFSEFSISGADGNMEHLPSVLTEEQEGRILVSVTSHLAEEGSFILVLSLERNVSTTASFDPSRTVTVLPGQARSATFSLADGESWERTISFIIPEAGERTLYLRLDDGQEVKELWLPLTIT